MPNEEKLKKPKRKKVNVRVSKFKKSIGAKKETVPFKVDLSSRFEEKFSPPILSSSLIKEEVRKSKKAETEKREKSEARKPTIKPQINLYRKIAFSFLFLTLALVAIIFYFSFVKVTIILTPAEENVSSNLIIDVYAQSKQGETAHKNKEVVGGVAEQIEVEETKTYEASGVQVIGKEVTGQATIINNYNKSQPLVATTRLLSSDGKLFRIKNTVNVPAGGSVEVEVYADQPSADMAIGPTKFTIPGLWAGLQDKIYAESKEAMQYQRKSKKYIQLSDIDAGIVDLRKVITSKAETVVSDKYKEYSEKLYKIDDDSVNTKYDSEVGDEKDNFSITMKAKVAVVAFSDESIVNLAKEKLASAMASGKELSGFNEGSLSYNLDSFNLEQGVATVNASFGGKMVLKEGSSLVDKEKVLGLSRQQLNDYLTNLPGIADYEVKFFPSFMDKVPRLADRVKIEIKK